jgi:hypothetical protein
MMVKQRILTEQLPPVRVHPGTLAKIEKICSGKMQVTDFIRNTIYEKIKEVERDEN